MDYKRAVTRRFAVALGMVLYYQGNMIPRNCIEKLNKINRNLEVIFASPPPKVSRSTIRRVRLALDRLLRGDGSV